MWMGLDQVRMIDIFMKHLIIARQTTFLMYVVGTDTYQALELKGGIFPHKLTLQRV
jgi:hypothetical protein